MMPHMRLGVLPPSLMKGMLPRKGNLGGPGGNFFGFLELTKSQRIVKTAIVAVSSNIFFLSCSDMKLEISEALPYMI
jgi:hypothetical protein